MAVDISERCGGMPDEAFTIAFAIYQRSERDYLRSLFGDSLTFVLLNVPEELLAERVEKRTIKKAESKGQTLEEYMGVFHPGKSVAEVFEGWRIRRSGFQPKQSDEPNTVQIDVTRNMDQDAVAKLAAELLGLPKIQTRKCGNFDGDWKWAGGTVLNDGKVFFRLFKQTQS